MAGRRPSNFSSVRGDDYTTYSGISSPSIRKRRGNDKGFGNNRTGSSVSVSDFSNAMSFRSNLTDSSYRTTNTPQGDDGSDGPSSISSKNKLRFDKLGLCGRKKEMFDLEAVVHRMVASSIASNSAGASSSVSTTPFPEAPEESHDGIYMQPLNDVKTPSSPAQQPPPPPQVVISSPVAATHHKRTINKEFVLLSGYAGAGKSALVNSLKDMIKRQMDGSVIVGKFDQCLTGNGSGSDTSSTGSSSSGGQQQTNPFTAFRMVCNELAREILSLRKSTTAWSKSRRNFEQLKDQIMMELGTELMDLIQVFPSLDAIISADLHPSSYGDSETTDTYYNSDDNTSVLGVDNYNNNNKSDAPSDDGLNVNSESRNRFTYAFRLLIRIVSSFLSPLIIVLDDLQWAEAASLDLLESLLSDVENKNMLMIIGMYRSNEVNEVHMLSKTIRHIESSLDEYHVNMTEMTIGNLDVSAVHEMIESLLSVETSRNGAGTMATIDGGTNRTKNNEQEIWQLAEICHKKTGGNAFYLVHFLTMLYDNHLLEYNSQISSWSWDITTIDQFTKATQNVVDILKYQMNKKLPKDNQQLLMLASYLGSVFYRKSIFVLWRDYYNRNMKKRERKARILLQQQQKQQQLPPRPDITKPSHKNNNNHTMKDDSTSSDMEHSHEEGADSNEESRSHDDTETTTSNENDNDEEIRKLLDKSLKACISAGFLERVSSSSSSFASSSAWGKRTYRWVHDKLQEAAMDLVPSYEQSSFCRHVAETLCEQLTDKELESAIFVVVNRFNEGGPTSSGGSLSLKKKKRASRQGQSLLSISATDQQKHLELAKLNLRAAKKAVTFSAFENAASYCKHGINLLPPDGWEKHYRLCLDLYSLGAETEGFLGNVYKMEQYCEKVLKREISGKNRHGSNGGGGGGSSSSTTTLATSNFVRRRMRPSPSSTSLESTSSTTSSSPSTWRGGIRDKFRVYNVMMNSISNRNLFDEAANLCLHVLSQYGTRFPKMSPVITMRIIYNIVKIKSSLKSRTAEEVQNLPTMDDPILIEQMGLVDKLATYLYYIESDLLPLAVFKSLHWTLEHGISKYAPPAFASTGTILAGVLDDLNGGYIYARYALLLLAKLDPASTQAVESRTLFLVHSFALHWTQPLESMLKPCLRGYEVGMQSGDTESASFSIYHYIVHCFIGGRNLLTIEHDCRVYSRQMKELKMFVAMNNCKVTWQMILNLMGQSQFKTRLTGEALKEDVCRKEAETNKFLTAILDLHKLVLYSFFGDYANAAKLALKKGDAFQKASPGSPFVALDAFHRGISLLAMSRQRKEGPEPNSGAAAAASGGGGGTGTTTVGLSKAMEGKYVRAAKKVLTSIKSWVEQGNPNVRHYECLLDAELAAYQGKVNIARKQYESAISIATRIGFVQDVALANERFGKFLFYSANSSSSSTSNSSSNETNSSSNSSSKNNNNRKRHNIGEGGRGDDDDDDDDDNNNNFFADTTASSDEATFRIQEAIKYYREWGSTAKAEGLELQFESLFGPPTN